MTHHSRHQGASRLRTNSKWNCMEKPMWKNWSLMEKSTAPAMGTQLAVSSEITDWQPPLHKCKFEWLSSLAQTVGPLQDEKSLLAFLYNGKIAKKKNDSNPININQMEFQPSSTRKSNQKITAVRVVWRMACQTRFFRGQKKFFTKKWNFQSLV